MANSNSDVWKRVIVVNDLPKCSSDCLRYYLEACLNVEVEEKGVHFFQDFWYTALVTLTDLPVGISPVPQKLDKPLQGLYPSVQTIKAPPIAILVLDVDSQFTEDHILYYFDGVRAGCQEGRVTDCKLDLKLHLARVTLSSWEDVLGVMAVKEHILSPSTGAKVRVVPYFKEFHEPLLKKLYFGVQKPPLLPKPLQRDNQVAQEQLDRKPTLSLKSQRQGDEERFEHAQNLQYKLQEPHWPPVVVRSKSGWQNGNRRSFNSRSFAYQRFPRDDDQCQEPADTSYTEPNVREVHPKNHYPGPSSDRKFSDKIDYAEPAHNMEEPATDKRSHFYRPNPYLLPSWEDSYSKEHYSDSQRGDRQRHRRRKNRNKSKKLPSSYNNDKQDTDFQELDDEESENITENQNRSSPTASCGILRSDSSDLKSVSSDEKAISDQEHSGMQKEKDQKTSSEKLKEQSVEQVEIERLQQEITSLKNMRTHTEAIQPYRLRLMTDFANTCTICNVKVFEKAGTVQFCGTDSSIQDALCAFLLQVQDLKESSLDIPGPIFPVLRSEGGQNYLDQLHHSHPNCSLEVLEHEFHIICAAHDISDVNRCLADIKRNIQQEKCTISYGAYIPKDFYFLKARLEKDYLVRITLSEDSSTEVIIDGLNGDVTLAMREIENHNRIHKTSKLTFQVDGALAAHAFKMWYASDLNAIKKMILKDHGDCEESESKDSYTLIYQCRADVQEKVNNKLEIIKASIFTYSYDLNNDFTTFSDRSLVINGLHKEGVCSVCTLLEQKLDQCGLDCFISIDIPPKWPLPDRRFSVSDKSPSKTGRFRKTRHVQPYRLEKPAADWSYNIQIGNVSLVTKTGDITNEKMDIMVNVIPDNLRMDQTAVGKALLKKCHVLQNLLAAQQISQTRHGATISTQVPSGNRLHFIEILHAVLSNLHPSAVNASISSIVQACLQHACDNGYCSIAFPPLGSGKKFGYSVDVVATAMVTATINFLQKIKTKLQTVAFVIYDKETTSSFIRIMKSQQLSPSIPINPASPQDQAVKAQQSLTKLREVPTSSLDTSDEEEDSFLKALREDKTVKKLLVPSRKFAALLCTKNETDLQKAKMILVDYLKSTFLYSEEVSEDYITKLNLKVLIEIKANAMENAVDMKLTDRDGSRLLEFRGQLAAVKHLVHVCKDKIYKLKEEEKPTRRLGNVSHEFPTYWKIVKKKYMTIEEATLKEKKTCKLHSVSDEESAAISQLVKITWDAHLVGAGRDARGLSPANSSIKVVTIERLENPYLWEKYSRHRLELQRILHIRKLLSFSAIENVTGSTGAVRTSKNIPNGNPLKRDIFHHLNEHYLFHGTKQETLPSIHKQGLDFRVANDQGMMGKGIYAAESATKADQYADNKGQRTDGNKTIILLRVLLGEPYLNKHSNPFKFSRPPCQSCLECKCKSGCIDSFQFDSVIDDGGRNFREFVVYDQSLCYPEYFITYQRV